MSLNEFEAKRFAKELYRGADNKYDTTTQHSKQSRNKARIIYNEVLKASIE